MPPEPKPHTNRVITFDEFWRWLQGHTGCIVSVATPDAVIYDLEELHWQLGMEDGGNLVVQVLRGKSLVGEVVIVPQDVAYVEVEAQGDQDHVFDCVTLAEGEPVASYSFTVSHGYTPDKPGKSDRLVH